MSHQCQHPSENETDDHDRNDFRHQQGADGQTRAADLVHGLDLAATQPQRQEDDQRCRGHGRRGHEQNCGHNEALNGENGVSSSFITVVGCTIWLESSSPSYLPIKMVADFWSRGFAITELIG